MTPPDLKTLLGDDRWMRRVAQGLLRNPHDAEDAVQDAWLAEIQGGRTLAQQRRGWLRGVLWNRASGVVRRERVLRERALDVGRERAVSSAPSSAEDAAAREVKRVVAEALLDLDDDLRTAVHLTYFADLSTREVAARTGVSPTAVRKRLARAHEELRRRLDHEHDGDRRGWTLALAPFLGARPEAPVALPDSRTPMRHVELLASLTVLVTAAATYSLLQGEGAPSNVALSRVDPAPSLEAEPTPRPPAGSRRRAAPPPTDPASRQAASETLIRARVERPDGTPAEGATWNLVAMRGETLFEDTGTVAPDGLLEVAFEPLPDVVYVLDISSRGLATDWFQWMKLLRGRTLELGAVRLRPESVLRCRLVDEAGEPVPEHTLTASIWQDESYVGGWRGVPRIRRTGPDGASEVEIRGLAPGRYSVVPYVRGVRDIEDATVNVGLGEIVVHEFVLPEESSDSQAPEPESRVRLQLTPRRHGLHVGPVDADFVTAIDASGASIDVDAEARSGFRLWIPGAFEPPLSISIEDPRFEPVHRDGIEPGDIVKATLVGTSAIRLDARDENGESVDLYSVRIEPPQGTANAGFDVHDGTSALAGRPIDGLYAGVRFKVIVRTDSRRGEAFVDNAAAGAITDVEVVVTPLTTIHGTVRHPDGSPAPFVEVGLTQPALVDDSDSNPFLDLGWMGGDPERIRRCVARTEADALGRFSIERPVPGDYLLKASNGRGVHAWSERFTVGDAPIAVDVAMPRTASVVGRIELPGWLDSRDLFVLPNWEGHRSRIGEDTRARVDSDGVFRIDGLPPTAVHFELRVNRDLYSHSETRPIATALLEPGETRELECDARASMPSLVRLWPAGFSSFPDDWNLLSTYAAPGRDASLGRTTRAPAGAPIVGPMVVEPGRWFFAVQTSNWAALDGSRVSVPPASQIDVGLDLEQNLIRRTLYIHRDGEPLVSSEIDVRLVEAQSRFESASFRTDDVGRLDVALPPGEIQVLEGALLRPEDAAEGVTLTWPPEDGAVIDLR